MQIKSINSHYLSFKRKLKLSEETDYFNTFNQARKELAGENCKNYLIIPVASLPQSKANNTGVGNLSGEDSLKFFDFAKKYWGINELQLLPVGQYHFNNGIVPIYSGTTMDFGNHIIDLKNYLPKEDFENIVKSCQLQQRIDYKNVINLDSPVENSLRKLHKNIPNDIKNEFELFKSKNNDIIEKKSIYKALTKLHNTSDFNKWPDIDKNLYNTDFVSIEDRDKRIKEINKLCGEEADYYKFKQFLAEQSFMDAKNSLNAKEIKLNGDIPCGFSRDEVWANPKAFLKEGTIGWNLPALDYSTKEAETLVREKVNWYAKHFDGFRIDAAWSYISPSIKDKKTNEIIKRYLNDEKYLKIIEDETKKIKGENFNLKNITYEFAADGKQFNLHINGKLNPLVVNRVKMETSDYLAQNWGSATSYIERGWGQENFLFGASNHDSPEIKPKQEQINELNKILKISKKKLTNPKEFLNAKLAEPLFAKNNMLFFMPAIGLKGAYKDYPDPNKNYTSKVPAEYEGYYVKSLQEGKAYNPMKALEKCFKSKGLNKKNPELYKKIVKYRKILEQKENSSKKNKIIAAIGLGTITFCLTSAYIYNKLKISSNEHKQHP